jgi:hypothetical protein
MGASTMRSKIGVAEFNHQLSALVKAAMEDGLMSIYEITGSMHAAMCWADRCATQSAQIAQQREQAKGIIHATKIPPLPPIK